MAMFHGVAGRGNRVARQGAGAPQFGRKVLADEIKPVGPGWVARTAELPLVWTLNQLCITSPTTFVEAVALADKYQADLPYRHINAVNQAIGASLEHDFAAAGWKLEREVFMTLVENPDRVSTRAQ